MPKASKKPVPQATKDLTGLPGSFRLLYGALAFLRAQWQVFLGIALVYAVLNVLLIQGLNVAQLNGLKHTLGLTSGGTLGNGLSLYSTLLGSSGSSVSPTAGVYQFILAVVVSLAVIWSLRQVQAGREIRIRDGFYRGMTPLITFVLTLGMVMVQLLPLALGVTVYGIVMANGIAVGPGQQFSFLLLFLGLAMVSLYMLSSSLFAMYIVTLPDVSPMSALRSARQLIVGRRWSVMRKIIFLPAALLVLSTLVMLPVVLVATAIAGWIFIVVNAALLVLAHVYMYNLYRALL